MPSTAASPAQPRGSGGESGTLLNPYAPRDVPNAAVSLLLWNQHWFGPAFEAPLVVTSPHGTRIDVELTTDRRRRADVSAIVIHGPTLSDLPERRADQPWVLMSMEANHNYPHQLEPGLSGLFDLTMTYRLDSDVPTPYANRGEYGDFRPPPRRDRSPTGAVACFLASQPVRERDSFVSELMEHIPIDSFGKCLNNLSLDVVAETGMTPGAAALAAISSYPFYLAFENCRDRDYVTEKLYRPLSVGTVPVYRGAPNVGDFLPAPNAALTVDQDTEPRLLAAQLSQILEDPDGLARRVAWQARPAPAFEELLDVGDVDSRARLATKLAHGCDRSCRCGGRLRETP